MTRMRTATPALRLAAMAVAAVAILPLSGCLAAGIPEDAPDTEPSASSAPEESAPAESDGDLPEALTFEAGVELSESAYIEWGDGLLSDENWEVVAPDNGEGGWIYGTVDGTCTAQFWQGYTSDVETSPGDDSLSSDAMIALLLDSDTATITPSATDGAFSYLSGGNDGVEHRQVAADEDGRMWIMAARSFATVGVGLYVIVDCTGADVFAVFDEVTEKNPIIVTP